MFSNVKEVKDIYEGLVQDKRKITHQGTHIIYKDGGSYSRLTRTLASGHKIQLYAHQLALLYRTEKTGLDRNMECSHLCHIRGCITPDHIVEEPHHINMNRTACANERRDRHDSSFCFGHQGYPNCM